tara:strand:+ start:120 stop:401 length:282 start_codon:yes stop_codon:yes gene_type:complete
LSPAPSEEGAIRIEWVGLVVARILVFLKARSLRSLTLLTHMLFLSPTTFSSLILISDEKIILSPPHEITRLESLVNFTLVTLELWLSSVTTFS